MSLLVSIAGVDRSSKISKRALRITDGLTTQTDKCDFTMEDLDEADVPIEGQEVLISQDSSFLFGGTIRSVERFRIGPGDDGFKIKCKDFSSLIEKRLVNKVFSQQLAGDIIKDINTNFILDSRVTVQNVEDGPVIDFIGFNFKDAWKAMQEIAKLTGRNLSIDTQKDINYFSLGSRSTPFNLVPGELQYQLLKIKPDTTQLRNRIIVRGGTQESDTFAEKFRGDTDRTTYRVSHVTTATPTVKVNASSKTVGIKNTDDGTVDFLFEPNDRIIENDQQAVLSGSDVIEISYKFKIPILVQVEDSGSINAVAAVEGSDGIYEFIIVDDSIDTLVAARERAQAEIGRFGTAMFKGSFRTHVDGFKPGQTISVQFPEKNLDLSLLITRVTYKSIGCGRGFYDIKFGSFSFDWQDFLLGLIDAGRGISVREGEVLDDLLSPSESVAVADAPAILTDAAPPFTWGPGGANPTQWNFGVWD